MKPRTFAEIYCERDKLAPEELNAVLFQRSLYPHARLLVRLAQALDHRHFLADYEFIEDVSHARRPEELAAALDSYLDHPANRGTLRRRFRIRISARRLLAIARPVLVAPTSAVAAKDTFDPFDQHPGQS